MPSRDAKLALKLLSVALCSTLVWVCGPILAQEVAQDRKPAQQRPQPAFAQVEEEVGLPRVLLIGDSISMGYTIPVRKLLAGKANVLRPSTNCGPSSRGVKSMDDWLGTGKWDVVHFNFGLHDIVFYNADGSKRAEPSEAGARHQVLANDYEKNLRTIVARLKMTGAELVWCSTTPVPNGAAGRVADEATQYNAIAEQVMRDNGVTINDLHAFALPKLNDIQQPKNVHFTPAGSASLAKQVAKAIEEAMAKRQVKTK